MEGTLARHEPGLAEHGPTTAEDERSGGRPGQAATSARGGKQELAHELGRPAAAWLAPVWPPHRYRCSRSAATPTGGWPRSCTSGSPGLSVSSPTPTRRRNVEVAVEPSEGEAPRTALVQHRIVGKRTTQQGRPGRTVGLSDGQGEARSLGLERDDPRGMDRPGGDAGDYRSALQRPARRLLSLGPRACGIGARQPSADANPGEDA